MSSLIQHSIARGAAIVSPHRQRLMLHGTMQAPTVCIKRILLFRNSFSVFATPSSYHCETDLQVVGYILIPEEEASESDLTTNNIHFAGGSDQAYLKGYPANVEVFHQIHCLVWPSFLFHFP